MTATTTLRALAAACEECDRIYLTIAHVEPCELAQYRTLTRALPPGGWPDTAAALRALASDVETLEAERDALRAEVARLRAVPRGCLDYLGGYGGRDLDIYHHGVGTVIAAMDHATTAPDFQTRVVESLGSERENERNRAALSGSISALRSIADGSAGAVAAREFLAWFDGDRLGVPHG